ncbi:hypothetical protein TURU_143451 [Turdus rufiventris]|nr:hypothetical protein TURU_143451 [Turdus rufiventris]
MPPPAASVLPLPGTGEINSLRGCREERLIRFVNISEDAECNLYNYGPVPLQDSAPRVGKMRGFSILGAFLNSLRALALIRDPIGKQSSFVWIGVE